MILDWRVLGYGKDETFCPAVRSGLSQEIGCEANVYIDEKDKQTVIFAYPPRHYYDLYRMAATPVKEAAFSKLDLLKKVVDFKMKFYPRAWAKYPEAVPGTLKLLPPKYRFAVLEADYNSMRDMLYGEIPTFDTVIETIRELEKEINS